MVFGDLVGGMLIRAGERANERRLREQELADWQRNNEFNLLSGHLARNWENMTPEQQGMMVDRIAPLVGTDAKNMRGLIGGAQLIHHFMPKPAEPAAFGSAPIPTTGQATHQVGLTPRDTTTAPPITMSEVPQVPSIAMAGMPGLTATGPSQTPAEMIEQRKFDQAQRAQDLERQRRISQIMASSMSAADKAMAIKALDIPSGILAAQERDVAGASSVGLNVMQLTSPDGSRRIDVQPTRTGQYVEAGTGRVIPPEEVVGWTKRYVMSPYMFTTPDSQVGFVNREALNRPGAPLTGTVQGTRVAEPHTATTDEFGNITGILGTRSGQVGPVTTAPGGPPATSLRKGPMATTELNTRTYMENAYNQLQEIREIVSRRPDLIGQWDYSKATGLRWLGMQKDTDANNLINALQRFSEDAIRAKEGAVIPDAMYSRLQNIVSAKGWANEEQFSTDIQNAMDALTTAREMRGMTGGKGRTAGTTAEQNVEGYGPRQQFNYNGKTVWGRRNLMTGKVQLEK